MNAQGPLVLAFAGELSGDYAQNYFLRQVATIPRATLVATSVRGDVEPPATIVRSLARTRLGRESARLSYLASFVGVRIASDPILARSLSRMMRSREVAYAMFLWNGVELIDTPAKTPIVVHVAGSDLTAARAHGRVYERRARRVLREADLVLAGSEFLCERVRAVEPRAIVHKHYIGVPVPEPTDASERDRTGGITVLAVSRLVEVKGVDRCLRAFKLAFGGRMDVRFRVAGDGPLRPALERLTEDLGLRAQVIFLGALSPAAVSLELTAADIFVQHNVAVANGAEEALGGSLLEASAHGLPVVASSSGGVSEAVLNGRTGLLVNPEDVKGMAEHLKALASDPTSRAELGSNGRLFIEESHNAVKQDALLRALLASVSSGWRPSAGREAT